MLAVFSYVYLQRQTFVVGEDVEKLKQRLSLLAYLRQQHWTARPAAHGPEFVGLCPLHSETRPSFYVNARKNLFYCHGCGQGGDLLRFVQLSRHLSCRHFLSTATRSLPRGTALSRATRTARSRPDQRTADRLCPRRELAPTSRGSELFLRSPATSRSAQLTRLRRLLPARHLPVLPRRTRRQPLRPQYRCRLRPSIPSRLQGRLVRLGIGSPISHGDSGGRSVRSRSVVASRFSPCHLLVGHPSQRRPVSTAVRPSAHRLSHLRCRCQWQRPTSLAAASTASVRARYRHSLRPPAGWPRSQLLLRPGR